MILSERQKLTFNRFEVIYQYILSDYGINTKGLIYLISILIEQVIKKIIKPKHLFETIIDTTWPCDPMNHSSSYPIIDPTSDPIIEPTTSTSAACLAATILKTNAKTISYLIFICTMHLLIIQKH